MSTTDQLQTRFRPSAVALLAGGLAALSGLFAPLATAQPAGSPAEDQLERLCGAMLKWSQGIDPTHDEVKAVFSADADPRKASETDCIRNVEADLSSYLEKSDPSLLPTLAFWQTQMLLDSMDWAQQPTLRAVDFDRLDDRLKTYRRKAAREVESLTKEQAERYAALTWTGLAEIFARRGSVAFYWSADRVLHLALEIDEDLLPARYLQAWVGEKVREPLDVIRPWRELTEDHPDQSEFRLRFALNASAAARHGTAIEELERVARGDGSAWIRVLAYQEWVQLLLEESRDETEGRVLARSILDEARDQLPLWPSLDLLASYLDLGSKHSDALRLAERVEAHVWPEGELSPRLRYELPNPDQLVLGNAELVDLIKTGRRDLAAYLGALHPNEVLGARSRRACR